MKLRIEARLGYALVGLSGALGDADVPDLRTWLDRSLFGGGKDEESPPFLLWDLGAATSLEPRFFAALVGFSAACRLRDQRVILIAPVDLVRAFILASGTGSVFHHALALEPAFRHVLADLPIDDADAYLRFLGEEQYAPVTDVTALAKDAPVLGEELAIRGVLTWGELVASRFHFKSGEALDVRAPERRGVVFSASNDTGRPGNAGGGAERGNLLSRATPENRKLGEILLDLGLVSEDQLIEALDTQRHMKSTARLGNILIQMNAVTMEQIFTALETQYDRRKPARGRRSMDAISAEGARGGAWEKTALNVSNSLLGEVFIDRGFVTREQLEKALQEQWRAGGRERLGNVLLRMGMVTQEQVFAALEDQASRKDKLKKDDGA